MGLWISVFWWFEVPGFLGVLGLGLSWTPKVCRIMAFWAIFRGFGPLFYLLWGFRVGLGFRM